MTHKIKVQMFGNFRMDYNGAPFVAEKMHKESQFNRMMQALIHYSDCGVAKDKLEEIVIGERDIDAPHTALRVIVYKTKQKLAQLGLPGKNLVYLEGGIYYWTPDIEIEEDAAEFEKLYNEACALEKQMPHEPESAETVCDERIKEIEDNMLELYIKALYLYKGEFLAAYTGETWIAQEARRYHIMFEKIINEAAYILRKRKQFKGLEKLGVYAAKVDPFNEWEELIMEAMVETRRYDEAEELYTDVVDYYLRECGIYPSSRLLEILEKYSNQMNHAHEILENIQEGMNEQEETERGGYFCSYPVFRGIYQASIRIMKRTRVPVYLMLCTLEDEEGRQVQSETKMNKYSRQLKKCVGESIRYSDIYTSYGKVQFLIFIIGLWPYMLASMLAILIVAIMSLDHTRKLSPKKINIWTVTIMMIIAAVQAYHKTQTLMYRVSGYELIWNKIIVFIQLIAGMLIVVYMCDRATKYGIGGKVSVFVVNIVSGMMTMFTGKPLEKLALPVAIGVAEIAVMIVLETTEKRIAVQRVSINNIYADKNYIAYKLNPVGATPLMFASAAFLLPQFMCNGLHYLFPDNADIQWWMDNMRLTSPLGIVVYMVIICLLTIIFSMVMLSPGRTADDLLKSGDSIQDIYAGKPTKRYLIGTVLSFSVISSIIICICQGGPLFLQFGGYVDASLAMLPCSIMMTTGLWISLYREAEVYRNMDRYHTFI